MTASLHRLEVVLDLSSMAIVHAAGYAEVGGAGYAEGLRDGHEFIGAATCLRRAGRPLILPKAGESDCGSEVTQSHTAALAGNRVICRAAFAQLGVVQARHTVRMYRLMQGFRGKPAADVQAAAPAIACVPSAAMALGPALTGLEINPLPARPQGQGVIALDALLRTTADETAP
ncbi:hypothetical protein [Verminephrobacter eiseniae]|uniref:Succinyl-CoA synthetase-like flavodoxin domain-containing protein n=1 Tax=Verminephrobacter eiseniae (strain EF01-2) TaxID=391735 RepID=A1WKK1_VEREI|nr:hypothetical protein [Verminephrobacter eiseniae]ABM58158.1 hypothetical protein Veis_2412 [Verminephrobacter eiseniae EF01-2]MCW5283760.1 hypothetical protein [Verminephrobacter eiseniae]MCW5301470.1 hypothetical protein [Verminephrobacter eiseniae]MCW8182281.1 hypothetical protein [Verminephrobacter eiseniae]MCW8191272.1 hypothetical protein [Verminephrobacter eiseniae]